MKYLFSSESVSCGHPDKLCDQISDAVLDYCLERDQYSKVACEVLFKGKDVVIAGEISADLTINEQICFDLVVGILKDSNYDEESLGFAFTDLRLHYMVTQQSPDIRMGVEKAGELGAGDQGLMFGYACAETQALMPFGIFYAHQLMQKHREICKKNRLIKPDAKCQITVEYENSKPVGIKTIVFSSQHSDEINQKNLKELLIEEVVKSVIPQEYLVHTDYLINQTGRFVVGGPVADCGLTGRKVIVDTYGGYARHGGGAFSGKDPTKVDRTGAYMARHLAKTVVANKLADRCEIQISYCIGKSEPVALFVNCFNSEKLSTDQIVDLLLRNFDLTPAGIIKYLKLNQQKYLPTAVFGHFGRQEPCSFSWENIAYDLV
ncbi:MAG: methionine adenosyltransferase [Deltaproteobacteria bacterium]|nr:methionine adenosyltransferase [Deltaproteobacteria bacterium]